MHSPLTPLSTYRGRGWNEQDVAFWKVVGCEIEQLRQAAKEKEMLCYI
jgi:hypothetical protein